MLCRIALVALLSFPSAALFARSVVDPNLKVQTWVRGLNAPTGAAFVAVPEPPPMILIGLGMLFVLRRGTRGAVT
jgi:hypothetical protein